MLRDAWRLAVGTLTALPVRPPATVDRRRAMWAMMLAPLAVLPLAASAGAIVFGGIWLDLPSLVIALLAIGAVVLGNRAFHLDGLSDVVDGMAASFDRERSLAVMKTGTSGPAGVVAIVLVVGLQVAAIDGLVRGAPWDAVIGCGGQQCSLFAARLERAAALHVAVLVGVALCVSRLALATCCARGFVAARPDGLGRTFTETVPRETVALLSLAGAVALATASEWAGIAFWRGALAAALALVVVLVLCARAMRRFGGVTGDVFGAAVELALATILVVLA
ncbi:adenosylcobinamide-GDP ribazoletransferase [Nocardioides sp. Kera G14]|uniref:adenosylcobinamide-GDP ribazoletransferase n=1 Tax=Nocardioides sp. Kera G14 TaxID=2884264 RepID=UPI001D108371|nr:adenosylcobinamide-GDP ribazoletransferase [Nocardioides sp. Kera G14]UDY25354.1 adenosylcobinamide-GDP ribazoletransferase [Nocardioides sp. Kera G14]